MSGIFRAFITGLLVTCAVATAQVTSGTIVGVTTDSSGAVIPGAGITVVHQGTQDTRKTKTNERGEFNVPFVRRASAPVPKQASRSRSTRPSGSSSFSRSVTSPNKSK